MASPLCLLGITSPVLPMCDMSLPPCAYDTHKLIPPTFRFLERRRSPRNLLDATRRLESCSQPCKCRSCITIIGISNNELSATNLHNGIGICWWLLSHYRSTSAQIIDCTKFNEYANLSIRKLSTSGRGSRFRTKKLVIRMSPPLKSTKNHSSTIKVCQDLLNDPLSNGNKNISKRWHTVWDVDAFPPPYYE